MELKKAKELLLKKEFEDCELMEIYLKDRKLIGIFEDCSSSKYTDDYDFIKENNLEVFQLRQGDDSYDPVIIEKKVKCNKYGVFILEKGELILKNKNTLDNNEYFEEIEEYSFI